MSLGEKRDVFNLYEKTIKTEDEEIFNSNENEEILAEWENEFYQEIMQVFIYLFSFFCFVKGKKIRKK